MGWASYFESDLEKIQDRAFMAATMPFPANCRKPAVQPRPTIPIVLLTPAAPTARAGIDRARAMRDIHLLCMLELRPKSRYPHANA